MVVNDNAGCLRPRDAFATIACRLAPTESPFSASAASYLRDLVVIDAKNTTIFF